MRGYKFGCVCSYMAGHYPGILMTGHIGTNTPKFGSPRCGRPFDVLKRGVQIRVGLEIPDTVHLMQGNREIAVTAVSKDAMSLQFASKELQGDRELVKKALSLDAAALEHASDELRAECTILWEGSLP